MFRGSRTVFLIKRGRKWAHAVVIDGNVDVEELPVDAWDNPDKHGLRAYPHSTKDVAQRLLDVGTRLGITERARSLLNDVPRNSASPSPDPAEQAAHGQEERLPTPAETSEA